MQQKWWCPSLWDFAAYKALLYALSQGASGQAGMESRLKPVSWVALDNLTNLSEPQFPGRIGKETEAQIKQGSQNFSLFYFCFTMLYLESS